ncbi:MAG: VOC family protein [Acidimicrobiia bacterium]
MQITGLGYIGIESQHPQEWSTFATEVLGMAARTRADGAVELRMDDRVQRVTVAPGGADGGAYYGWEVPDATALDVATTELEAVGVAVKPGTDDEIEARGIDRMVHFEDPTGARVELFHGAHVADTVFVSPRGVTGFVTGDLGLGHYVLLVSDLAPAESFYTDTLGFRVSDYVRTPLNATFLHANARHHSFAMLEAPVTGLHHFLVEVADVDDVGRAYDLAVERDLVGATLGRHTNDLMLSFYVRSPSGFLIEYGTGGLSVDDETWEPVELTAGVSIWGHAGLLG